MEFESLMRREADAYYVRNIKKSWTANGDPVLSEVALWATHDPPKRVLEIGCASGFRLQHLTDEYGSACHGLEASYLAVQEGSKLHPGISFKHGVAPSALHTYPDAVFDLVILGFIQYLLPRDLEFPLAAELNRVTSVGGRVVAFDFMSTEPTVRSYHHDPHLVTYKTYPSRLLDWSAKWALMSRRSFTHGSMSPANGRQSDEWVSVDTLMKLPDEIGRLPVIGSV